MSSKKKVWPSRSKQPENACCLICGRTYPLWASHLIPQHLLNKIPEPTQRFFTYKGFNVVYMCTNHSIAFDAGKLEPDEMKIVAPYLKSAQHELGLHLISHRLDSYELSELEAFIKLHTYE